jgi:hypothetical protein
LWVCAGGMIETAARPVRVDREDASRWPSMLG